MEEPGLVEHPAARILLAIIPAALVFLFFVSVFLWVCLWRSLVLLARVLTRLVACGFSVPVVQSAADDAAGGGGGGAECVCSPHDVLAMLDESAPSMAYGAWLEQQQKTEDAMCVICLDVVDKKADVRDLPCAHVFHTVCLDKWVSRAHYYCPLCHRSMVQHWQEEV